MTEQGMKHDAGKPPLELLPFEALIEVAKVLDFGAKKYAAHNWRGGLKQSRVCGAALRHIAAHLSGEDDDPETGLSHLAHAMCELGFALTYHVEGRDDLDDRYRRPATAGEATINGQPATLTMPDGVTLYGRAGSDIVDYFEDENRTEGSGDYVIYYSFEDTCWYAAGVFGIFKTPEAAYEAQRKWEQG